MENGNRKYKFGLWSMACASVVLGAVAVALILKGQDPSMAVDAWKNVMYVLIPAFIGGNAAEHFAKALKKPEKTPAG